MCPIGFPEVRLHAVAMRMVEFHLFFPQSTGIDDPNRSTKLFATTLTKLLRGAFLNPSALAISCANCDAEISL